ncbi:CLUMA_CG019670, isoform A [Clunio marinus]|uniref:CLUMA_CG019670, isoform A n=1 Tax=Clunio marinus TaxID=568069 RepID=A0A1J1J2Z8_9DIPT|nr:CLUMA_CG019670, isoform A [Clunio marinus]
MFVIYSFTEAPPSGDGEKNQTNQIVLKGSSADKIKVAIQNFCSQHQIQFGSPKDNKKNYLKLKIFTKRLSMNLEFICKINCPSVFTEKYNLQRHVRNKNCEESKDESETIEALKMEVIILNNRIAMLKKKANEQSAVCEESSTTTKSTEPCELCHR